jgi:hypothetical protein
MQVKPAPTRQKHSHSSIIILQTSVRQFLTFMKNLWFQFWVCFFKKREKKNNPSSGSKNQTQVQVTWTKTSS